MDLLEKLPVVRKIKEEVLAVLDKTIEEHCLSFFLYEFKVEELDQSIKNLKEKRDEIQQLIEDEFRKGKRRTEYVSKWLDKVKDITTKNDEFWQDKCLPYTMCSKWYLPKPGMRYRLAKKAYRIARQVNSLCKTTFSSGVSSGLWPLSTDFLFIDDNFEFFDSRKQVTENVIKAMKDTSIKIAGVYGMGGVGKTTLVKEVAIEAQRLKLFDVVILATVTRNPDIKQIQGQLADQLCARLNEESEIGRASRLRDIFKKEKKNILVVLDDLWAELDLNKLGIPVDDVNLSPHSAKDTIKNQMSTQEGTSGDGQAKKEAISDSKMLKILLTSRQKGVVCDKMNVNIKSSFAIDGLKDQEAEALFKKIVGMTDKHPDFEPLAVKISKRCGGLPIAIVTMGKTLRTKSYSLWNETLHQLEQQEFSHDLSTKLSFKYLENEELKSTFLLCAHLGYHPLIMELVKHCIGVGIFEGFLTIKETREKVLRLIEKLKDSSLLLDSYSDDRFNMHDLIRESALSIAHEERHFFTMRNGKLKEWPHEKKFEKYNGISVKKCEIIDKLPTSVSCPRLEIFHVDSLNPSFTIPEGFFIKARQLKVLILTGIDDTSNFCASIGCLADLRMLCLEKCKLGDMSFIGKLEKLRILGLSGSIVEKLPKELGKLRKLQLLDINNCSELKEIPPNVMSSLNDLEELYMRNSLKWESEENQSGNSILAELRHLHELKNLDICLPSAAVLPRNLFLNNLDVHKIVIGDIENLYARDFKMPAKDEASRVLALHIKECNVIHYQNNVKMLFRRVEILFLGELNGVRNIFCELNLEGFPCLKELSIVDNSDIECIIDPKELLNLDDVFPILQSLCLRKLRSIKKIICHTTNLISGTSFSKLKVVRIHSCAQLENVFFSSMVELLKNVETIDISECMSMKTIVLREGNTTHVKKIHFPKLRTLVLADLHDFTGVYSNDQGANDDRVLLNEHVEIPSLESLELSSIDMNRITISSQSKLFENLTKLDLERCDRIQYVLSFSMAKSMKKLKVLSVRECEQMVEIFKYENDEKHEAKKVRVFPNLEKIHLHRMRDLKSIWPSEASPDSFTSLNSMSVRECCKLVTVLPSHMVGRFGSLKSLTVFGCRSVEKIFDLNDAETPSVGETQLQVLQIFRLRKLKSIWNGNPEGILKFQRLHRISVASCGVLEYLFPVSVAIGLQELDFLSIGNCLQMEEIVRGDENIENFKFPQVTVVEMKTLPKLVCFFKGGHTVEWPKLKKLSVFACDQLEVFKTETQDSEGGPIFLPEMIIHNLESMEIDLKQVEKLKLCIKNYRLNHMKNFLASKCPSIEILYPFLYRMPYLERLTLDSSHLTEILPIQENIGSGNIEIRESIGTFPQLKYLELVNLKALENIGFERGHDIQYFLEHLLIRSCQKLENLAPSSVTLTQLTTLEVSRCSNMKNLMGISTAKSLVQLVTLKIVGCKRLEKIIAQQKDEVEISDQHKLVLSKLMTVKLLNLRNLSSFCNFEICDSLEFPSLEKLKVNNCPRMTIFCNKVCTAPNLQLIDINKQEENWSWKGNLNDRIQKMNQTWLPEGTHLSLSDYYSKFAYIWDIDEKIAKGLEPPIFSSSKTLVVENCGSLSTVVPSHLLAYLSSLKKLEVRSCSSVVAIFDGNDNVTVKPSKLKTITLDHLPNMKHVWSNSREVILSFKGLSEVSVIHCDSVQTLFPEASITRSLEKLTIQNCGALEEIVGKVKEDEEFRFPDLSTLNLGTLPKLKSSMKVRCPSLNNLIVYNCNKFTKSNILASESQSYQGANAEDQISTSNDSQSFFSLQQVGCLKQLSLTEEEANILLCNGDVSADILSQLKTLRLHCFHNVTEADTLPFEIFHKLPKVDTLEVANSDLNEIFPHTLDSELVNQLKSLSLEFLPKLNSIGIEHQEKLKYLHVERCPHLTKLVSFSNLEAIVITRCQGLEYLVTAPTAGELSKLRYLTVSVCESIKEIVAQEEEGEDSDVQITFKDLVKMKLYSLPRLACFYAGTATLNFPKMSKVEIVQCPSINYFSQQGHIIAPEMRLVDSPPCVRSVMERSVGKDGNMQLLDKGKDNDQITTTSLL